MCSLQFKNKKDKLVVKHHVDTFPPRINLWVLYSLHTRYFSSSSASSFLLKKKNKIFPKAVKLEKVGQISKACAEENRKHSALQSGAVRSEIAARVVTEIIETAVLWGLKRQFNCRYISVYVPHPAAAAAAAFQTIVLWSCDACGSSAPRV